MLVTATERMARQLGHDRIALAVDLLNPDAERLYRRLGYRRWGHGQVLCFDKVRQPDGSYRYRGEICHVLVKDLTDPYRPSPLHEALLVRW
jgi:RimJ/RimL family protein N-acetyltransferase